MITIDSLLEICAGFTVVCVSGGWLIKIIKNIKKPADEISNQSTRLDELEKRVDDLEDANKLIINALYQMLDHFETNNNTGGMRKCKQELIEYLNS